MAKQVNPLVPKTATEVMHGDHRAFSVATQSGSGG